MSLYSYSIRARRSGARMPVAARFYALVQTSPGAHSWGVALNTHPRLAQRLKKY